MIGTLRATRDAVERALADWLTDRAPHVAGFLDAGLVFCDDGATIVNYARHAYPVDSAGWWPERGPDAVISW